MCTRMIPALVSRGARQRRRTADGRARARHVEGTQRVLKRGYSTRVLKRGTHSSGEGASGACGRIRRIMGGQCSAALCTLGVWQYVSGTHGVLKGYSQPRRTHGVLLGYPHSGELSPAAAVRSGARACSDTKGTDVVLMGYSQGRGTYPRGTPRVLIGCSRVLTWYSQGTDRVLKGTPTVLIGCSRVLPRC